MQKPSKPPFNSPFEQLASYQFNNPDHKAMREVQEVAKARNGHSFKRRHKDRFRANRYRH